MAQAAPAPAPAPTARVVSLPLPAPIPVTGAPPAAISDATRVDSLYPDWPTGAFAAAIRKGGAA
jgi:hypothetical protein